MNNLKQSNRGQLFFFAFFCLFFFFSITIYGYGGGDEAKAGSVEEDPCDFFWIAGCRNIEHCRCFDYDERAVYYQDPACGDVPVLQRIEWFKGNSCVCDPLGRTIHYEGEISRIDYDSDCCISAMYGKVTARTSERVWSKDCEWRSMPAPPGPYFSYNDSLTLKGFGIPDVALTGDFDGDGKDDLMWYESWGGKANVFLSDGNYFYYSDSLTLKGFGPPDLALTGDFDGDGKDDLMWYESWGGNAKVFLSYGP